MITVDRFSLDVDCGVHTAKNTPGDLETADNHVLPGQYLRL